MNIKLRSIVLIDDNEAMNYLNKLLIEDLDCTENLMNFSNAYGALEFLEKQLQNELPAPDLLLLDLNMPGLDGWEFINRYREMDLNHKETIIIILTTSFNPDDEKRAAGISEVNGYRHKPLTENMMEEILEKYFGEVEK